MTPHTKYRARQSGHYTALFTYLSACRRNRTVNLRGRLSFFLHRERSWCHRWFQRVRRPLSARTACVGPRSVELEGGGANEDTSYEHLSWVMPPGAFPIRLYPTRPLHMSRQNRVVRLKFRVICVVCFWHRILACVWPSLDILKSHTSAVYKLDGGTNLKSHTPYSHRPLWVHTRVSQKNNFFEKYRCSGLIWFS